MMLENLSHKKKSKVDFLCVRDEGKINYFDSVLILKAHFFGDNRVVSVAVGFS